MFDVGQMDADLMSAAGLDLHIEQREFIKAFDRAVESRSLPSIARDSHLPVVSRVAADRRFDLSGILPHYPIDHRGIGLHNRTRFELFSQIEMRAVRFRHNDQSRRAHVQAVHYAWS